MNTSHELCSCDEIVEKIKDVLSKHITQNRVYDWHVADALGIDASALASMKRRNRVPFKEVLLFCYRCGLDPYEIMIKKKHS